MLQLVASPFLAPLIEGESVLKSLQMVLGEVAVICSKSWAVTRKDNKEGRDGVCVRVSESHRERGRACI